MNSDPRPGGPAQEEDRLPGGVLFAVLAVVVVLTAGGIWWGVVLGRPVSGGTVTEEPRVERPSVSGLPATLIGVDTSALAARESRRRALDQWRWLQPDQGIAQIPIDVAMRLVAERTRAGPPPESAAARDRPVDPTADSRRPPADSAGRQP